MGALGRRHRVELADVVRVLPRYAHDLPRRTVDASQRWRLLEAMIEVVAKVGYAEANVADAIAIAGVSRKTFYEHFRDKEACFVAAHEAVGERLLADVSAAGNRHPSGPLQRHAVIAKFLERVEKDPLAARVFLVDALGAGGKAMRMRRRLDLKFEHALLGTLRDNLTRAAILGGIIAIVVAALLDGDAARLPALADAISAFVEQALR